MLASAILVLAVFVERVTTTLMDSGRALHVYGHPADRIDLTLQELLMLALVALAADGVMEWLTGRRITRLLVGMVLTVVGSFPLLALLLGSASLGFMLENIVVVPMCVGAMLITVLSLAIHTRRIQQRSAVRRSGRSSHSRRTRATLAHAERCSSMRAITILLAARKNTTGWRTYRVGWVHR